MGQGLRVRRWIPALVILIALCLSGMLLAHKGLQTLQNDPNKSVQYIVGTDGRTMFAGNSLHFPWKHDCIIPNKPVFPLLPTDTPWRVRSVETPAKKKKKGEEVSSFAESGFWRLTALVLLVVALARPQTSEGHTEETMQVSLDTGCYAGMTVYPISKLTPERVSAIIREYGSERMIVDGSADWGVSDPLSLVKVVERLRQDGVAEEAIKRLVYGNAMSLYGHSPNWKPDFGIQPMDPREFQR